MKMNNIFKYLISGALALTAFCSCDSFLDRQEDEAMTFEKIWERVSTTRQYFFNCMGYLPTDDIFYYRHESGASDEGSCTWAWSSYQLINFGTWNASNLPNSNFNTYYEGIRDCNIFMQNVFSCSDPSALQSDLTLWYNCARWARAYMYFLLMRDFGPIFLVGDELMDFTATAAELERPRNTWEECVDYVVSEMTELSRLLPESYSSGNMGLPTSGAALAVISRLTLYSARDQYNGNTMYSGVVNPDGTPLFPQTYNAQKWLTAADAAKAVIDLNTYSLYRDESDNPYLNYLGITHENWNSEIIFSGGGYHSRYTMGVHTAPSFSTGGSLAYGGWGPTQQQVDAYAMSNGRYPITGYEGDGSPIIDSESGYPASEFTKANFENPFMTALGAGNAYSSGSWPVMYRDREPRFYVSVFWGDSWWKYGDSYTLISFCQGANAHTSHDYPKPGYLVNRYYDHSLNSYNNTQWGNITFPTFRLGEIYLNYIEAVLECERNGVAGESVDHNRAMELWAELRDRSGMAPITDAYPNAGIDELVELVRKERRVELAFEGLRYYDTRTWLIAEDVDGGPMYGMNTAAAASGTVTSDEYWQRTAFETRIFRPQDYLFPFPQRELDRNNMLTQNYRW